MSEDVKLICEISISLYNCVVKFQKGFTSNEHLILYQHTTKILILIKHKNHSSYFLYVRGGIIQHKKYLFAICV